MKLTFRFSSESELYGAVDHIIQNQNHHDAITVGNDIMAANPTNSFNGLDYYTSLRNVQSCTQVDISKIAVRHNSFCHGFKVTYRSTFSDGSIRENVGPEYFYSRGYYSYHSGPWEESNLELSDDEYIRGMRLNQGDILDGITFVTNHREVHFGGRGGAYRPDSMMLDPSMKIIALAGKVHGVVARVGFYAISRNWEVVGHFIVLRKLLQRKRASIVQKKSGKGFVQKLVNSRVSVMEAERRNAVLAMLMDIEKEDIFRYVLKFLIHS